MVSWIICTMEGCARKLARWEELSYCEGGSIVFEVTGGIDK